MSWKEGRAGEKSPWGGQHTTLTPSPILGGEGAGKGAYQTLERNLEGESIVSGERELSAASCCWEIKSDDHRETTGAFGSLAAVGDTDCENTVPPSTARSGRWKGLLFYLGSRRWMGRTRFQGRLGENIAAPCPQASS